MNSPTCLEPEAYNSGRNSKMVIDNKKAPLKAKSSLIAAFTFGLNHKAIRKPSTTAAIGKINIIDDLTRIR